MLKDKLDELEQVKLNLDLKMNELKIENKVVRWCRRNRRTNKKYVLKI
ncbi:hypothetical protein QAQ_3222 [Clostridioides difficile CD8]|nr:hypothetical protein QAQ_3222 [Clostridioides difficile CD8]EQI94208.1 hypothetical protein QQQ_3227 [Clostridioides difficile P5]EQJ76626.1 hypothetical protein QU7_3266 [Clostridioides difficile P46]EQK14738.1 hypothetical protein QUU_3165 [Clostridioides difficile P70]